MDLLDISLIDHCLLANIFCCYFDHLVEITLGRKN